MIPNTNLRTVTSQGVEDSAGFKISVKNAAHIMTILRDTLYSDKVLAVLREYSANAWDAHRMSGKADVPIKVTMPVATDPVLRIRDFGPGLSRDEMFTIFTQYGESTKRDTDEAVGMLGIGSKSGFAYSESFTVTSWNGGTKAIYNAVLDASDEGHLSLLWEEPCGDETGLEIQIAVKQNDIVEFHRTARGLFQWFNPRPDINIELPPAPDAHDVLTNGILLAGSDYDTGWVAIMGCVPYRVDLNQLVDEAAFNPDTFRHIHGAIFFKIGDVRVNASREELKYSDDTKKKLAEKLTALVDEFVQRTLEEIDKENLTPWQKRLRAQVLHTMHLPAPIQNEDLFAKYVPLKDIPVDIFTLQRNKNITTSITVDERVKIYVQDDRRALRGFGLNEFAYVVKPSTGVKADEARKAFEAMLVKAKLEGVAVENLSSLPWTQPVVGYRGRGGKTVNVKHRVRAFKLDPNKSYYGRPYSSGWLPEEEREATDDDVYVVLENFKAYYDFYGYYCEDRSLAKFLGIDMPTVYGYKSTQAKPVTSAQGTEYRVWRQTLHDKLKTDENKRLLSLRPWARAGSGGYVSGFGYCDGIGEKTLAKVVGALGEQHPIACYCKRIVDAKEELGKVDEGVINWLVRALGNGVWQTSEAEVEKEKAALLNRYPMIKLFEDGLSLVWNNTKDGTVVDYIKLIDKTNEEK